MLHLKFILATARDHSIKVVSKIEYLTLKARNFLMKKIHSKPFAKLFSAVNFKFHFLLNFISVICRNLIPKFN